MMLPISQQINHAYHDYYDKTGKPPTVIYLGYTEWKSLLIESFSTSQIVYIFDDGHEKMEYRGLRIVRVIEQSYLAVGVTPPPPATPA